MSSNNESTILLPTVGILPPSSDDLDFIKEHLHSSKEITKVEPIEFASHGGYSGAMKKLLVEFADGTTKTYICKTVFPARLEQSKQLGLSREAYFYHHFADILRKSNVNIPEAIFTHGDLNTGHKTIILEDLSSNSVQSGYFFGAGSPHNWGKDLSALVAENNHTGITPSMEDVSIESFKVAARIHSTYWADSSLFEHVWLRSSDWLRGEGIEGWNASQKTAANSWRTTKEKIENSNTGVKWDEDLVKILDASIAKASWEVYQEEIKERKWTLVHGDFHPANLMFQWNNDNIVDANGIKKVGWPIVLDFEVVGLGNGAQDIAQYLISHMAPSDRKLTEEKLLREYYDELLSSSNGKITENEYSWETCKRDYVKGGTERWIWLLALISNMCPDPVTQYFQNQVAAFLQDHSITPDNVGMPRV